MTTHISEEEIIQLIRHYGAKLYGANYSIARIRQRQAILAWTARIVELMKLLPDQDASTG